MFRSASLELWEDPRSWSLAYKKRRRGVRAQESHRVLVCFTTMLSLLLVLKTNRRKKKVTSKGAFILSFMFTYVFPLFFIVYGFILLSGFLLFQLKYSF